MKKTYNISRDKSNELKEDAMAKGASIAIIIIFSFLLLIEVFKRAF